MALTDKLTAIADAIRSKTGGTDLLTLDAMPSAIEGMPPQEDIDAAFAALAEKGVTVPDGATSADLDELILSIVAALSSKNVTPTKAVQTVTPDDGYAGLSNVTVEAIPAEYVTTTDATATAEDILLDKTAYVNGQKIVGTLAAAGIEYVTVEATPAEDTKQALKTGYLYGSNPPDLIISYSEFAETQVASDTSGHMCHIAVRTTGYTYMAYLWIYNNGTSNYYAPYVAEKRLNSSNYIYYDITQANAYHRAGVTYKALLIWGVTWQ